MRKRFSQAAAAVPIALSVIAGHVDYHRDPKSLPPDSGPERPAEIHPESIVLELAHEQSTTTPVVTMSGPTHVPMETRTPPRDAGA